MKIEELMEFNTAFVKMLKGDICPQLVIGRGDRVYVFALLLKREETHEVINKISEMKPDWVVFMSQSYYEKVEKDFERIKTHEHGNLEKRFKSGDKTVREGILIQVYTPDEKLSRGLDKETLEMIGEDTTEFGGFLTISDVDRVFWKYGKNED